jgi:hypothetical protein
MADDVDPRSGDELLLAYAAPRAEALPVAFGKRAFFGRAVLACAVCIAAAGAFDGIAYFVAYEDRITMDWPVVATVFVLFILAEGLALGAGTGAGILAADAAVARLLPKAAPRRPFAAIAGATIGGALAVIIPSALGTLYFGSKSAPFVGTVAIAIVPVVAVLLASATIAAADARMFGRHPGRAALFGWALLAAIPLGGLGGLITVSLSSNAVPRWAWKLVDPRTTDEAYALGLSAIGALAGTVLGAALGLHIGVTTAFARWRTIA